MATQARWHSQELAISDEDPFQERVEQVGLPIRLDGSTAELNTELLALVDREKALFDVGITCAIKDRADTSCSVCPINAREDPSSALRPLCRLGLQQEQISTELAIAIEAGRRGRGS